MADFDDLARELKQLRDEIALKVKLASMEVRDEWQDLETQWHRFSEHADLETSAEEVGTAMKHVGEELKKSYVRIKSALKD
jgi:hypothetical protein